MSSKQKYIEKASSLLGLHLFNQPWWLDAVAGKDGWDVLVIIDQDEIIAAWPFIIESKSFFRLSRMPKFTQKLGPWISSNTFKDHSSRLSIEKKIINQMIDGIPNFHWFEQTFDWKITNWMPFYWQAYHQTTKYTYKIDDISKPLELLKTFDRSKQKNIKRAEEILQVKYDLTAEEFYNHHKNSLKDENSKIRYSLDEFKMIYDAGYSNNCGKSIYTQDDQGNIHSAFFFVWDTDAGYNLISTINPKFRNSGSASLLIFEMIKYLSSRTKSFDFCGSMIETVERSFRRFGAKQYPYFKITKFNSGLIRIFLFLSKRYF